jgi:hypothetical protein
LSYAVPQISIAGASEFSRRPIDSENSGDKKTKQKVARRGSPFLVTFLAKQKSDLQPATPAKLNPSSTIRNAN